MTEVRDASRDVSIQAKDLKIYYDKYVALQIPKNSFTGNVIAVIGHNGAGKSTMIKGLLGLLPITQGTLKAMHANQLLVPEKHMAFCPEEGAVFADITVESYVKLWCRVKHRDANYYRKGGSRFIELLHLEPLLGKLGRELSKGQRRRVQTAIGFIANPKFFLFDEPFDGLDVQKTTELADIIQSESKEISFLVSSHRMDVVERIADEVVVLKQGLVVAHGSVDSVCKQLCDVTLKLTEMTLPGKVAEVIREKYPKCLVSRIGDDVEILGKEVDQGEIISLAREVDKNGVQIMQTTAGLVDAMNFHLRDLAEY